jgi:hypothetical protein
MYKQRLAQGVANGEDEWELRRRLRKEQVAEA